MKSRKTASAIGYSAEDTGPRLLVTGKDRQADRIIALAHESGVAVVEDSALASLLESSVNPGELIPVWCWEAAARVLAFVRTELPERHFGSNN
jgi:type III secretion system FlhB-like substrate exporter